MRRVKLATLGEEYNMKLHQNSVRARLLPSLLGASALAVGFSAPALAQVAPAAEDDTGGLQEIVVTARKVAENLQDVPIAVTAFSGEDLQSQNVQKVQDIAKFTPGLNIRPASASPAAIAITLRGQVQTDNLITLDPSVGTYVDGVYWARAYGLNGDLLDIQSVQVLKGPQGTLFGRNTTGGALLFNTNNPEMDKFSGRLSATYGRFNERQLTGVVNVPIVNDKVALRVAVQRTLRDGYTTNSVRATGVAPVASTAFVRNSTGSPGGLKYDNRDRWSGRAKLEIRPTENFSLLFSAEYFDVDERGPSRNLLYQTGAYSANTGALNIAALGAPCVAGAATNACANTTYSTGATGSTFTGIVSGNMPAAATAAGLAILNGQIANLAANPSLTSNNELPYILARTHTYNSTASLDTFFGNVKLIGSYRKIDTSTKIDLDGTDFAIHVTEGQQKVEQYSGELQITGKAFSDTVDFAAGAFAFNETGFDQSISITIPALNPATSHFFGIINNDSIGAYAQATVHLSDQLSFTGGLRYSVDDKGLETRNNNYNRTTQLTNCSIVNPAVSFSAGATELVAVPQCAVRRRDSFAGWSYTAGVEYKPTDDILLYAKTAKGFRSGGQNLRAPNTQAFIPFAPEVAYSYEIGAKAEFFDRRVRLNLAVYQSDVSDIQRTTLITTPPAPGSTTPGTATILSNAGKARFRGVELEFQALLAKGLRFSATGGLVNPKYISFADLSGDRSFERFSNVAEEQFSLALDYTADLGSAQVKAHVDYAWTGATPLDPYFFPASPFNAGIVAATTRPANGQIGARLGVDIGDNFEIALFGRNLTNERFINSSLIVAPFGYVSGSRTEPRTYGVTGTVKF
ncbi:MAG: hypothetical protein RLZZ58_90 [Pseudomonadota bacterium]